MNVLLRLFLVLFLLTAPLWRVSPAAAQAGGALIISAPETRFFPSIQFHMDAYDAQGNFINGLKTGDVQIIENGQTVQPATVEKLQNGLQLIIALNTNPAMATQSQGISSYQQIQAALVEWAKKQPANTLDDVSFSTPTGLYLIRERKPGQVVKAFTEYQPDLAKTQPSLGSLAEALDLATDPLDNPLTKRAILYITPAMPATANETITDLTSRAKGTGVRVNVWVVGQANSTNSNPAAANPMQQLAEATGGQYQEIPSNNPLPEIEPLFKSLRGTYQVTYNSAIQKGGAQHIKVQIKQARQSLTSNEVSFQMDVQPPSPIFLSPPASITRSLGEAEANAAADAKAEVTQSFKPESVPLQILIEFPDQHQRSLKATRLYVNGEMIAENTEAPFDRFTWSIADLNTAGRQMLRVEAIDALNLTGSSAEIPVDVLIEQPVKASIADHISSRGIFAIVAVTISGAVLVLVLVFSGTQRRTRRNRQQKDKKLQKDPVTQPVHIKQEPARQKKKEVPAPARSSGWPTAGWPRNNGTTAPARLVALDENGQPITGGSLALARQEITFGTDPQRATQIIDSPTIDGLHARLYRDPEGHFFLADQNSVAGTWINFAPINGIGMRLEHGDLIHIGRAMYRFELTEPEHIPTIEVQAIDLER